MAVVVVSISVVIAVYTDLRWMVIPNWMTYPLLVSGLLFQWTQGHLILSLVSGGIGGLIFLIPALFGQVGMGDVKWFAGIGSWTSLSFVVIAFVLASVVGLFYVLGTLGWKMIVQRRAYLEVKQEPIPYGVSLGAGILTGIWIINTGRLFGTW